MKIAIIGAGAMGCLFGAHLSKAHEVTMFDIDDFSTQIRRKLSLRAAERAASSCSSKTPTATLYSQK